MVAKFNEVITKEEDAALKLALAPWIEAEKRRKTGASAGSVTLEEVKSEAASGEEEAAADRKAEKEAKKMEDALDRMVMCVGILRKKQRVEEETTAE